MCGIHDEPRRAFTREELQAIKNKAMNERDTISNKYWKRALVALADAADRVDAMIARTEERNKA